MDVNRNTTRAARWAFLGAAPVLCLPTFGWAQAVDTDPPPKHPAAAVVVAGSAQGLELESPDRTSGGFLANLNELLAPKEVLRDIMRLGSDSFKQDAFVLGGSTALSLLAVDDGDELALSMRPQRLGAVSNGMSFVGSRAFLYPVLVSTFFIAKATERPGLSRTAAQMTQALLLTDILVTPIKLISRRTRPDGSNERSFPSGHTAGAFALATVLQHNHGLKVGLPAYAFASLMGAARVDERKHFVSDVIVGAVIGYFAACTVNKRFAGAEVQVHMVRDPSGGKGVGFTLQF